MSYTITIQSDGADAATTVRIDDSGARPRVTEVSVRASAGTGLTAPQLPAIDPDLLLSALSLRAPARAPAPSAPSKAAAGAKSAASKAQRKATPTKATKAPAASSAAAPARVAGAGAASKAAPAKAPAAKAPAAKAPAGKATAAKATKSSKAAKASKAARPATKATKRTRGTSSRAYRRTPDDLAATYGRIANISAVARHYGVPRHTAQGWIARLRQQG